MKTVVWSVDKSVDKLDSYPQITQAAKFLIENEVVAFPTETVYGLGGNAENSEAVAKIFSAKGRPSDNPLIIHIADVAQLEAFVTNIPETASLLMEKFWPGPLTIVLNKKEGALSKLATAGLSTVAVRMPNHPLALALIRAAGLPIAAPSANQSGKPSPTLARHVFEDLNGKIAGILDGGATGVGVESTVIDCTEAVPVILRPGGVTKEQIEAVIGAVRLDPALSDTAEAPRSPGMKYLHYAPNAPMYLVDGPQSFLQQLVDQKRAEGIRVGVLTTEETASDYHADVVLPCGRRDKLETVASLLYETLRAFNEAGVEVIYSETFPETGVGQAIMNRLQKAAGHRIIRQ